MLLTILYILLAIVVLLVLITVHEFGHYIAGKVLGFKINEFSIGFGKAIFKKNNKKTGELFAIRMIPLGGFCAFEGEDEDKDVPGAFNKQPAWKRLIVLFSGVFFNFVFGVLMCIVYLCVTGFAVPQVSYVPTHNPNNFQVGDIIYKVNGKELESYRTISDLTKNIEEGEEVVLTIKRDGTMQDIKVKKYHANAWYFINNKEKFPNMYLASGENNGLITYEYFENYVNSTQDFSSQTFYKEPFKGGDEETPAFTEKELIELGLIGKVGEGTSFHFIYTHHAENYTFIDGVTKCFDFAIYLCWLIITTLFGLFSGATPLSDVGGTITAVSQIAEITRMGVDKFLLLVPFLSFNLAIFNALPIPALDGARMLFVAGECITRKPINRTVEGYIHMIGLFVLLGLVLFLDVYHFFIS